MWDSTHCLYQYSASLLYKLIQPYKLSLALPLVMVKRQGCSYVHANLCFIENLDASQYHCCVQLEANQKSYFGYGTKYCIE